ncbi:MAG: hypothetical protein WCC04_10315 [Terriglobales bacterium]|jgi:hypothetical protein
MKKADYLEGQIATENFEEGMKALFKVPKTKAAKVGKKLNASPSPRPQKPKRADED